MQRDIEGKPIMGKIHYTVWSDVFICPSCSGELVFWDVAVDKDKGEVLDTFTCPHCHRELKKGNCTRAQETHFDTALQQTVTMARQVPVLISYSVGKTRYQKEPDDYDFALIEKIEGMEIPYWYPMDRMCEGSESRRNDRFGITHVHQFYTKRNLWIMALLWKLTKHCSYPSQASLVMTGIVQISSKQSTFRYDSRNTNNTAGGILKGTLYVPSVQREGTIFDNYRRRLSSIISMYQSIDGYDRCETSISISSLSDMQVISSSVDYIFTDPPFGGNLNYSELSFIWEAWLKVFTNQKTEAIINNVQEKALPEYQELMTQCFAECYRILKPGRWMTVEFHNSQNSVWNAIQEALQRVGFVVADVRTLDKKQGSFKQVTTTAAVKQDLVISAYKPRDAFREEFTALAGREETAWAFTRQHLENLPVVVPKGSQVEVIIERQKFLLFDRMVAYHIMNGLNVPIDASDFYQGLEKQFVSRDGMYFLTSQVNEYDNARLSSDLEPIQFELLISNERSAIVWLYQQLATPQTYGELQPKFMQESRSWERRETQLELSVMLSDYFLKDDADRWYIPDHTKEKDRLLLRQKNLLREFDSILQTKGKLRSVRSEAVRAGFAKLWDEKIYALIVATAQRLPSDLIEEDAKLLMFYDLSLTRVAG